MATVTPYKHQRVKDKVGEKRHVDDNERNIRWAADEVKYGVREPKDEVADEDGEESSCSLVHHATCSAMMLPLTRLQTTFVFTYL